MIYKRFSIRFRSGQKIVLSPLGERVKSILFGLFVREDARLANCRAVTCCILQKFQQFLKVTTNRQKKTLLLLLVLANRRNVIIWGLSNRSWRWLNGAGVHG